MLKITLLNMLYHEFDHILSEEENHYGKGDRNFRTIYKSYDGIDEIQSVTMEERYLPKSVLYYIWINDQKETTDISNLDLCRWIFLFAKENFPDYLKKNLPGNPIEKGINILDCFNVSKIPDYRNNRAYSDLTITTMDDVKKGNLPNDTRQATFPGMRFSEKYKKETNNI